MRMRRVGEWVVSFVYLTMMMDEMRNLGVYIMITFVYI
jgi:hypothetical protein